MAKISTNKSNDQKQIIPFRTTNKKNADQMDVLGLTPYYNCFRTIENKMYTQWDFDLIVATLRMFSDPEGNKLTSGDIARYIHYWIPEYGETPKKRKKLEKQIRQIENNKSMDDSQKSSEIQKVIKKYYDNKISSIRRTVKNQLNSYFDCSMKIIQLAADDPGYDEEYTTRVENLSFCEDSLKMEFGGVIRSEYSKKKRCDVYWFEGILDRTDIQRLGELLMADRSLPNGYKQFLLNAITMAMLPSLGVSQVSEMNNTHNYDESELDKEYADMRAEAEMEDAKEYASSWDEYVEMKQYALTVYKNAA